MKVVNETRNEVLAEDAKLLVSALSKALGLMFRRKPKPLVFLFRIPRKVYLHMFFVFCTIDVLFVGKNLEVVDLKEGLEPWQTYKSKEKCRFAIELPEGVVEASGTHIGDKLDLVDLKKNI